jgi:hypothetical protein
VVSAWRDDGGGYPLAILLFHKSSIRLCKSPLKIRILYARTTSTSNINVLLLGNWDLQTCHQELRYA